MRSVNQHIQQERYSPLTWSSLQQVLEQYAERFDQDQIYLSNVAYYRMNFLSKFAELKRHYKNTLRKRKDLRRTEEPPFLAFPTFSQFWVHIWFLSSIARSWATGPNTATGHTSVIFTNECQADYIIQLIRPILERQVMTVEVKSEPTDAYNEKIQSLLSKSVFANCQSWYRVSATGKISNIFPG